MLCFHRVVSVLISLLLLNACGNSASNAGSATSSVAVQVTIVIPEQDQAVTGSDVTLLLHGDELTQTPQTIAIDSANSAIIEHDGDTISLTAALRLPDSDAGIGIGVGEGELEGKDERMDRIVLYSLLDQAISELPLRNGIRTLQLPAPSANNINAGVANGSVEINLLSTAGASDSKAYLSPDLTHTRNDVSNLFVNGVYRQPDTAVYLASAESGQQFSIVGFAESATPTNYLYGFLDQASYSAGQTYTLTADRAPSFMPVDVTAQLPLDLEFSAEREYKIIRVYGIKDGITHQLAADTYLSINDSGLNFHSIDRLNAPDSNSDGVFIASEFPADSYVIRSEMHSVSDGPISLLNTPWHAEATCHYDSTSATLPNQFVVRTPDIRIDMLDMDIDARRISWRNAAPSQLRQQSISITPSLVSGALNNMHWHIQLPADITELTLPQLPEALASELQNALRWFAVSVHATDATGDTECSLTHAYYRG